MLGGCCGQVSLEPEPQSEPAQRPSSTVLCERLAELTLSSEDDAIRESRDNDHERVALGEPVQVTVRLQSQTGTDVKVPQFEPHPLLRSLVGQLREATTAATLELSRLHGAEFGLSGAQ
eukprot:6485648-Prymnesium_polylepis.1